MKQLSQWMKLRRLRKQTRVAIKRQIKWKLRILKELRTLQRTLIQLPRRDILDIKIEAGATIGEEEEPLEKWKRGTSALSPPPNRIRIQLPPPRSQQAKVGPSLKSRSPSLPPITPPINPPIRLLTRLLTRLPARPPARLRSRAARGQEEAGGESLSSAQRSLESQR